MRGLSAAEMAADEVIAMANNRLYIVDRTTGDVFLLAKSFGVGWQVWGGERAVGEAGVPLEERLEWGTMFVIDPVKLRQERREMEVRKRQEWRKRMLQRSRR